MSMADRDGVIWLDGELVPWREAKVHVLTHTLHYGMGVFEGVRAYETDAGTAIFRLEAHTDRLFRSAHILGMNMPYDKDTLNEVQRTVVRENGLKSAYLRPMCFLGSEGIGVARGQSVHPRHGRRLGMGRLSGYGEHGERHPHSHLVVHAPSRQHYHVQGQGKR